MKDLRTIRRQFWTAAGLLTCMAATFCLMPYASSRFIVSGGWSLRIVGALFWLFTISGYTFVVLANRSRKQYIRSHFRRDIQRKYRPGLLCVWSNPLAIAADIALVVFLAAFTVSQFTSIKNSLLAMALLAGTVWAVHMHCLFNGKIYRITKI